MQKRKFDELISHFNRKVSDMSIDQKYKMELLGMISTIGFAHEKELGTNLAEVGTDCISRRSAIEIIEDYPHGDWNVDTMSEMVGEIKQLPPIQPAEPKRGKWILDRSGAYCCSECMEPCAGYVMMKPRDKFCKMCGAKMEVTT